MLKDKVDTIKHALVKVDNAKNKKSVENLVALAVILVITVVAINYIWKDDKKKVGNSVSNTIVDQGDSKTIVSESKEDNLEDRLSEILSNISGVGEVKVLLTYSETNKINPVYNEDEQSSVTEETDTSGGKRTINSTNNKREVVYSNDNVVTQSISSPQIQGAVVIAKGAENVKIKTDIIQAVSAATGLSTYKIQVFEMK